MMCFDWEYLNDKGNEYWFRCNMFGERVALINVEIGRDGKAYFLPRLYSGQFGYHYTVKSAQRFLENKMEIMGWRVLDEKYRVLT